MKKIFFLSIAIVVFNIISVGQNLKATFDPIESYKNEGRGFYADFEFTVGFEPKASAAVINLTSMKINFDKGYYRRFYSKPVGKFYKCPQLEGLCQETIINSFWIHIFWEYNGSTYENGGQFTGQQKGAKFEFINIPNYFTPPSDIPVGARKDAKIKKITISSCSLNTSDKIESIILKQI